MLSCLIYVIVLILISVNSLLAADIALTVTQKSLQDSVLITVINSSSTEVSVESVGIELDKKKYGNNSREMIGPRTQKDFFFSLRRPDIPGSYILVSTVKYLNDGIPLTVNNVNLFNTGQPALIPVSCNLETTPLHGVGALNFFAPANYSWNLVVPEEIEVLTLSTTGDLHTYQVKSRAKGFSNVYQIFGVAEAITGGEHQAGFCSAMLTVSPGTTFPGKGWLPGYVFIILAVIFYVICALLILVNQRQSKAITVLLRYGSRMFFLSIACWTLKEMGLWLASSMNYLTWSPYQGLARILLDNIHGGNYGYFFQFFVDGYFVLCLLFIFPCLNRFDRSTHSSEDKYVASFTTVLTLPKLLVGKRPFWNGLGRLGLLTIMVKFFFTPMMVSWAIGSIYTIASGARSFQWNVYAINAYLVQLLILIDTVIFSLGYLLESKYLKNEIKSVDATILGWLVCLWCYPPFNTFSFKPFDFYIIRFGLEYPAWLHVVVLCVITCLWGIFVWASVALGFKASNLTNRGIVRFGPYRYVRHPAYTAKLMIWVLQGIFFAQFGIFILLGFIIIYVLRAWTEERHLSRDPDYLVYKQSVRKWFIPGVI